MSNKTIKIIFALFFSFIITNLSYHLFLDNTPKLNPFFFKNLFSKKIHFNLELNKSSQILNSYLPSFLKISTLSKPTIILQPSPFFIPSPAIDLIPTPTIDFKPIQIIDLIPTPTTNILSEITPNLTPNLIPTNKITPTTIAISCPTKSNQKYSSLAQTKKINYDPEKNPETNLYLRGWYEVDEDKNLISRNGDNYGLDDKMPPQISSLFTNHYPKIIKTYRINAWDYKNNHNIPGESATPAFSVHMLGLEATPGEPLVGLKAERKIDGKNVFLVSYATKNYILFFHASSPDEGYSFYFIDICVDPNLLATYEKDNANGRKQLPVIATGQVFGYAASNEVKVVVRDTGSFMDIRHKEDWWEWKPW